MSLDKLLAILMTFNALRAGAGTAILISTPWFGTQRQYAGGMTTVKPKMIVSCYFNHMCALGCPIQT